VLPNVAVWIAVLVASVLDRRGAPSAAGSSWSYWLAGLIGFVDDDCLENGPDLSSADPVLTVWPAPEEEDSRPRDASMCTDVAAGDRCGDHLAGTARRDFTWKFTGV
jgi:hypothetical protein